MRLGQFTFTVERIDTSGSLAFSTDAITHSSTHPISTGSTAGILTLIDDSSVNSNGSYTLSFENDHLTANLSANTDPTNNNEKYVLVDMILVSRQ